MNKTLAQLTNPALPPSLGSGDYTRGGTIVGILISNIAGLLFLFAFLLTFLYLIMGGIAWITAGGDKGQLETARNKITNALMGLVVVAAAYAVFTLVGQFFGLNIQALKIPSFSGN
jgi:hypothetical protein